MQDKHLTYGLLAGAALIVGGLIYYYGTSDKIEQEAVDPIIDGLKKLGQLKRDHEGYIDFEQFCKIFEISSLAAKEEFAAKKKTYVQQRREIINNKDAYKKLVIQMTQEEEKIINEKLGEIQKHLNIDEKEFQKNAIKFSQDDAKNQRMMEIQKNQQSASSGKVLSREVAIKTYKIQNDIQFMEMEQLMKDPNMMKNMVQPSLQDQFEMMMSALVQQCRAQDRIFKETGIEEEQLLYTIEQLGLEQDPEFQQISQEANKKAMALTQQTQGSQGLF